MLRSQSRRRPVSMPVGSMSLVAPPSRPTPRPDGVTPAAVQDPPPRRAHGARGRRRRRRQGRCRRCRTTADRSDGHRRRRRSRRFSRSRRRPSPVPMRDRSRPTSAADDTADRTATGGHRAADGREPGGGVASSATATPARSALPRPLLDDTDIVDTDTRLQGVVRAGPPRLLRLAGASLHEQAAGGRSRHRRGHVRRQRRPGAARREWRRRGVPADPVSDNADWTAEYGRRVGEVMDLLADGGRTVIWVGIPNDDDPDVTARMQVQDEAGQGRSRQASRRDRVHRHVGAVLRSRRRLGRVRHRSPRRRRQGRPRRRRVPPQRERRRDPRPRHRRSHRRPTSAPGRRTSEVPSLRRRPLVSWIPATAQRRSSRRLNIDRRQPTDCRAPRSPSRRRRGRSRRRSRGSGARRAGRCR